MLVTPGNGIVVQYRNAQGRTTEQRVGPTGTVPTYLMVARSGNAYTAYTSSDGYRWTLLAGSSVTLSMSGPVLAGVAVTSPNTGALSTGTFVTLSISTTPPSPPSWPCGCTSSPTLAPALSASRVPWEIAGAR